MAKRGIRSNGRGAKGRRSAVEGGGHGGVQPNQGSAESGGGGGGKAQNAAAVGGGRGLDEEKAEGTMKTQAQQQQQGSGNGQQGQPKKKKKKKKAKQQDGGGGGGGPGAPSPVQQQQQDHQQLPKNVVASPPGGSSESSRDLNPRPAPSLVAQSASSDLAPSSSSSPLTTVVSSSTTQPQSSLAPAPVPAATSSPALPAPLQIATVVALPTSTGLPSPTSPIYHTDQPLKGDNGYGTVEPKPHAVAEKWAVQLETKEDEAFEDVGVEVGLREEEGTAENGVEDQMQVDKPHLETRLEAPLEPGNLPRTPPRPPKPQQHTPPPTDEDRSSSSPPPSQVVVEAAIRVDQECRGGGVDESTSARLTSLPSKSASLIPSSAPLTASEGQPVDAAKNKSLTVETEHSLTLVRDQGCAAETGAECDVTSLGAGGVDDEEEIDQLASDYEEDTEPIEGGTEIVVVEPDYEDGTTMGDGVPSAGAKGQARLSVSARLGLTDDDALGTPAVPSPSSTRTISAPNGVVLFADQEESPFASPVLGALKTTGASASRHDAVEGKGKARMLMDVDDPPLALASSAPRSASLEASQPSQLNSKPSSPPNSGNESPHSSRLSATPTPSLDPLSWSSVFDFETQLRRLGRNKGYPYSPAAELRPDLTEWTCMAPTCGWRAAIARAADGRWRLVKQLQQPYHDHPPATAAAIRAEKGGGTSKLAVEEMGKISAARSAVQVSGEKGKKAGKTSSGDLFSPSSAEQKSSSHYHASLAASAGKASAPSSSAPALFSATSKPSPSTSARLG